ncbi:5665_t:CDS:2, partial [Entrophospora sp. SA101]
SKVGSGGVAGYSETNDPYFMKNHLGSYECKLCLTLHTNEGSYLAHTQGKKHQTNLARRAAHEAKENNNIQPALQNQPKIQIKKNLVKIGRPGYKYPEIGLDVIPHHRFMSAYEQRVEPPNKAHQYLLFAAEPYETISFKVQSKEVDKGEGKFFTHWDPDSKQFSLQFFFKNDRPGMYSEGVPPGMERPPIANPLNPFNAPTMRGPTYV